MAPRHLLIASVSLVSVAVALLTSTRADDPKPPPPAKAAPPAGPPLAKGTPEYPARATDAEKREIDLVWLRGRDAESALREKLLAAYPFESLEDRLRFDAPGRKRVAKLLPTPDIDLDASKALLRKGQPEKVPPAALATLLADERLAREGHFDRVRTLATLHKLEVQKFVTNPGFGYMRMVDWRGSDPDEAPPADWSEGDRGEPVALPKTGSFFTAGQDKNGPTLPSALALAGFHAFTAHEFARPDSWGLVKDKTQVAGFRPHALEFVPDGRVRRRHDHERPIKDAAGKVTGYPLIERWAVGRVELIGLLMHESPVAYLNPDGKLPSMAAVKEAKTRGLTEFESNGLKDLAAGKEVVAVDAATNQLRMVGAIRMAGACQKCHDGKPGDLLGAFSYELVRVPVFVPAQK
jgi:hypothetical protein